MPTKTLPAHADLNHLKRQAKDLLRSQRAGELAALQRWREFHPRCAHMTNEEIAQARLNLSDAQWAIAREYGYASWTRLRERVAAGEPARLHLPQHERIEDPDFRRAVDLLDAGEADALRTHLRDHPHLARARVLFEGGNYFRDPTLLQFCAENPIRHGRLPGNIVEMARIILDAGAASDPESLDTTVALVASGRVAREAGVQTPLLDLLVDRGARPDAGVNPALVHGEIDAVRALLRRGAATTLPVAVALGKNEDVARLASDADAKTLQLALAIAAQEGRPDAIRELVRAGADPDQYNPPGGHSHATPLHVAVAANRPESVRALVEAGARLDIQDIHFQGTPLDWAIHEKRAEIEAYLRSVRAPTRRDYRVENVTPILRVESLERSLAFYLDVLGFRLDWTHESHVAGVSLDRRGLMLVQRAQGARGTWVWIGVNDVRAAHDALRARGANVRHAPRNYPWGLEMHVEDPDGHVLRFASDPLEGQPFDEWVE